MLVGRRRRRKRKFREAVVQVLQREGQAQRQLPAGGERVGEIAEAPGHLEPALELPLAAAGEPAPGVIEIGLLADAREDVGHRPAPRTAIERLIAGEQRHAGRASQGDQASEVPLLGALEMSLDLHEAVVAAEDCHQPLEKPTRGVALALGHRTRQRTVRATGQAHEPTRVRRQIVEGDAAGALRRTELETRDQPTEIAVPVAVLDQHRQAGAIGQRQLAADERAHAGVLRGAMKAGGPVDSIAIDERQRRHPEPRRLRHERLRLLRSFQKRERGLRV